MRAVDRHRSGHSGHRSAPKSPHSLLPVNPAQSVEDVFVVPALGGGQVVVGLEANEGHVGGVGHDGADSSGEQGVDDLFGEGEVAVFLCLHAVLDDLEHPQPDAAVYELPQNGRVESLVESCVRGAVPKTPFFSMSSLPTWKGERLTAALPADSRLDWMMTLMVSMGWMTEEATLPDSDPTRKGLA